MLKKITGLKPIKRYWYSPAGLVAIGMILLLGVAAISWMQPWRIDLTENHLYTLSPGTLSLLKKLEDGQTLTLDFYYSDKVTKEIPSLRNYARRVRETLEEYTLQSKGKIVLHTIDPEPFSEAEDQAAAMGLRAIPAGNNDNIYFGLVGEMPGPPGVTDKKHEIIEFFDPQKESSLEYDISQLIYRLHRNKPLVVGIISDIPVFQYRDARSGQVNRPKIILEQMRQMFDVRRVYDSNIDHIDDEIDVLMAIHPHLWPESTLYAIDQFVLRGGHLVAFMDPKAEMDHSEAMIFGDSGNEDKSSSLEQLLTAWGVQYDPKQVLLDYNFAHTIPVTQYGQAVPHVGVLGIRDEGFNRDEAITAHTDQVNLASTGVLSAAPDATTTFTPLMKSSGKSELVSIDTYNKAGNHEELLRQFQADGKGPYTIAALITGPVKTAFPNGKPKIPGDKKTKSEAETGKHLSASTEDIAVALFADTDILDDRMWVQVQDFYGQLVARPWANNSDLVMNVLEKLGGSVDLINVRSRGTFQRPFDRVNDLERQASERLRQQEQVLQKKLSETEDRLQALNNTAGSDSSGKAHELTPEQQVEVEKFQQERLQTRKKLRDVQHQLNQDIEQLGSVLKALNMLAVPLLLALFLLIRLWLKRRILHASRPE